MTLIHPSILYTAYSFTSQGGWNQSQFTLGERRGTPWTGRHHMANIQKQTAIHTYRQFRASN